MFGRGFAMDAVQVEGSRHTKAAACFEYYQNTGQELGLDQVSKAQ